MSVSIYRSLLWELIAVLDEGGADAVEYDEAHREAEAGRASQLIKSRMSQGADFSTFTDSAWKEVDTLFEDIAVAVNARKKFGVERKGIALYQAYALEGLQRAIPRS